MAATVGDVLKPRLTSDAAVTALVGDRIFPSKPLQEPGDDEAYLCYWNAGGGDGITLSGPQSYRTHDVRIEAVAKTQAIAEAAIAAAKARLHGWRDVAAGVQGCFAQGDADETVLDDGFQISGQSFSIRFKPS